MIKKSPACADRQPYSLCSSRKSLSQQLDCPAGRAAVRTEGERERGRARTQQWPRWGRGALASECGQLRAKEEPQGGLVPVEPPRMQRLPRPRYQEARGSERERSLGRGCALPAP